MGWWLVGVFGGEFGVCFWVVWGGVVEWVFWWWVGLFFGWVGLVVFGCGLRFGVVVGWVDFWGGVGLGWGFVGWW